jgi:TRAP transporter TAXI family solute receptor
MLMKRIALLAVCMILALAVLLAACPASAPVTSPGQVPQDVDLIVMGFRAGTSQQLRADTIAEALRVEYPSWQVTSLAAGGEAQVISKRIEGEADFFFTMYPRQLEVEVHAPLHPEIDFEAATAYSAVMPLTNRPIHFLALPKTGLNSIADIVEKKYPFKAGTGAGVARLLFEKILGYYGSSLSEAETWGAKCETLVMVMPEGIEALQAGTVDMGLSWGPVPYPAFMGITFDLKLLPFDDPGLIQFFNSLGYDTVVIPAGSYSFVTEDVPSVTDYEFLVTRPDMPDDIVYYTLKALFNRQDMLIAASADIKKQLAPAAIAKSLKLMEQSGVPIHPGALKFYREMGWVDW